MDDSFDIFSLAIPLSIPAYLLLQVVSLKYLTGGWHKAACLPLILAVPITGWCLMALAAQSNLWPLTLILFAPLGALYLLALLALRVLRSFIPA